jgi:hypothetical protein
MAVPSVLAVASSSTTVDADIARFRALNQALSDANEQRDLHMAKLRQCTLFFQLI